MARTTLVDVARRTHYALGEMRDQLEPTPRELTLTREQIVDLDLLGVIAAKPLGRSSWGHGVADLRRKGYLRDVDHYMVEITERGLLALRGVFEGERVTTREDRFPWSAAQGVVKAIREGWSGANILDQHGYVEPLAQRIITVEVEPVGQPWHTWCFYDVGDLRGAHGVEV